MNQNSRKTAKTKVEKDFHKLLNNTNFGNDCRNNIGHCSLELLYDGLDEISYLKRFMNIMQDWRYREFFSLGLKQEQIQKEYDENKKNLDETDSFYPAILESMNRKKKEDLEAIDLFAKKNRKRLGMSKVDTLENKISNCHDLRKNKMIIEFNDRQSSSVKSIAVKSKTSVQCMEFMSGKLLMFTKLSLKSFVYSLVELLAFPDENPIVAEIYQKYDIDIISCYQVLTDTDSKKD